MIRNRKGAKIVEYQIEIEFVVHSDSIVTLTQRDSIVAFCL